MNILITGSKGFIGKNLISELKNRGDFDIFEYDKETDKKLLDYYTKECNFVFHLAGVNRPKSDEEFMEGNYGFTKELLDLLKKHSNKSPVLITSSIQANYNNPYGKSKRAGEELLKSFSKETGSQVFIYRLPNLFGKWSKPNYNTVVATYCYNIARGLEILVNNPETDLQLAYIDDVVEDFIKALSGSPSYYEGYCTIPVVHNVKLGTLAETIKSFKQSREDLTVANMENNFIKKLYSTYLSFLPKDQFIYNLKMNKDDRGSFTEFLRTPERGQVSVNITKSGITKGNHWHHSKNEKFLVVSGEALIKFRKVGEDEIVEYRVSDKLLQVVDIPTGYVHNITNIGDKDLVTVMWANESYNPDKPDTYHSEV
ncbi:capsular polysaccharide biosynthesis protein CapF [Alkalicella caledoniensis]|uniref:Capsular polysaccharide biosynthesis protein CapF n=1 Tax=Alkalicella caledoniensis TaxID=2731377 RepID=A0A7G9W402_ALKCA|nr:capsular polysaccharide biosynthesis protein CapF [Alkalicella caledoniensis]QNO13414.1 capsular polysaccharide biosynthesis protein CapF [Alkalicella caledoniensis]